MDVGLAPHSARAVPLSWLRDLAEFDGVINTVFGSTGRDELIRRLRAAAIAFGEINDVAGLSDHPALRRVQIGSPSGPVDLVAPPALINNRVRDIGPIPETGAHSQDLREEFAG